jgi:hypothetical protein
MRAKTTTQHHDHNGRATANEEDKHDGIGSASKQSTERSNSGQASASTTTAATSTRQACKVAKHPPSITTTTVRNPPASLRIVTAKHPPRPRPPTANKTTGQQSIRQDPGNRGDNTKSGAQAGTGEGNHADQDDQPQEGANK